MKPVLLILACLLLSACTHTSTAAPRSSLGRAQALAQARMTADTLGGGVCTVAATGSMRPVLDEHTIVALDPAPFAALNAGDIVLYRARDGRQIIHRLYQRAGAAWFVLGDNRAAIDPEPVTPANYTARVAALFYTSP